MYVYAALYTKHIGNAIFNTHAKRSRQVRRLPTHLYNLILKLLYFSEFNFCIVRMCIYMFRRCTFAHIIVFFIFLFQSKQATP